MSAEDRCAILAEALKQWKCSGCGGNGIYQPRKPTSARNMDPRRTPSVGEPMPCKVCKQSGLNPIATAALEKAGVS